MAKVTPESLHPIHSRMGRAALRWTTQQLGEAAGLTASNIRKFEYGRGLGEDARRALIDALDAAGVDLLNGKRPGARLRTMPGEGGA